LKNKIFVLAKFILVGMTNTILGFVIFTTIWLLSEEKLNPLLVLTISYTLVFLLSYLLQRSFVFRSNGLVSREVPKYIFITATSVLLNGALLALFTGEFGIGVLKSQAIALVLTSSYSFIGHMHWTFKVRLPE
jgi:putative flippase GtrA